MRKRAMLVLVPLLLFMFPPTGLGAISSHPATGTPELAPTGTTEQVRQLVQCGTKMYAVGTFTEIQQGRIYGRSNVFSFRATRPYTVSSWNPNVNGEVNSIAFGSTCAEAYIGGSFTKVHGSSATNIAEISTKTGAVNRSFRHDANAAVETLRYHKGHLLTGGYFTSVNGGKHAYMSSLNPRTGKDDGYIHLGISGSYNYCHNGKCANDPTRVFNQQLSHSGKYELIEGAFTRVGGKSRQQVVMLKLGKHVSVTGWDPPLLFKHCVPVESFYARAASWAPNDKRIYIASTGFHSIPQTNPLTGLCDSASAFPARQAKVKPKWINYTGCDSLYSTVASTNAVFFGGHERWSENPRGCNHAGPGAISAPGMEGLSPRTGKLILNPTNSRGIGADDMLINREGLWIADDDFKGVNSCGGVPNHAGICEFP